MSERWIKATVMGSLIGLSASGVAWAEAGATGGHPEPHGRPGRAAFAEHYFERMDENKDGQVTQKEAEAAGQRLFDKLDTNQDGEITRAEAEAGLRALRQEASAARFKQLDANGDGRLTAQEAKLPAPFFERLDTNKDHALTLQEFQARPDWGVERRELEFDEADKNHDGKVTREEAAERAKARFDSVDANHDGVITHEELTAHIAEMGKAGAEGSHGGSAH